MRQQLQEDNKVPTISSASWRYTDVIIIRTILSHPDPLSQSRLATPPI